MCGSLTYKTLHLAEPGAGGQKKVIINQLQVSGFFSLSTIYQDGTKRNFNH